MIRDRMLAAAGAIEREKVIDAPLDETEENKQGASAS
jgi:hypothetical protein